MKSTEAFMAFRDAGERLGELHIGYEAVKPWPAIVEIKDDADEMEPEKLYCVTQMKHPGTGNSKDRSVVFYNPHITVREIPVEAWEYVINGKPALSWVIERQCVKTDKASGIVSDANRYATETVGDPRYPLVLFLRMITVSMETVEIVKDLPTLENDIR